MDTVTVHIGTLSVLTNGGRQDLRRKVEFVGEEVAARTEYYGQGDTRGITETLYRADDGRLVVHVENWSKWQGEPNVSRLAEAEIRDLEPGGRFEYLGAEAGYGRALTLDEALTKYSNYSEFED